MLSPTYGKVTIEEAADIIRQRVKHGHGEFNVMVGTDSQTSDSTKTVVVIALHHVGYGGIFFYDVAHVRRIDNLGQKLLYETQLSLEYARKLIDAFETLQETTGFDYEKAMNFCIHVDAGMNGPSKKVIPEIVGWITACGYKVIIKPESFAASTIANRISK